MELLDVVKKIGDDITASQLFSCKNPSQGRVIALACLTTGRDILSIPEEYHLMNTRSGAKLTMQAGAMLARLVRAGGKYEILEHNAERCAIRVNYDGRTFEESLTNAEAQLEPFYYRGSDTEIMPHIQTAEGRASLKVSGNYATPRRRMQHLWARVVSDAVRVAAPDLVSAFYTPEEVADYSGLVSGGNGSVDGVSDHVAGEVVGGKRLGGSLALPGDAVPGQESAGIPQGAGSGMGMVDPASSVEQIAELKGAIEELAIPDEVQKKIFAGRGCTGPEGLTESQATELLESLRKKVQDKRDSQPSEVGATSLQMHGPVTKELEATLRSRIKQVAQSSGGGKVFVDRIVEKLQQSGMMLKDLSLVDAEALLQSLDSMEIESFFARQLSPVLVEYSEGASVEKGSVGNGEEKSGVDT